MSTAKSADGAVIGRDPSRPSLSHRLRRIGPLPILILIAIVIFAWGNPRFLSEANVTNISQQLVYLMIVALAQMLVLIAGGFDLSVGSQNM